ncbi:putative C6 transcription factor QutA [Aspergillus homomorphus CBS 101889]|uniref:Quinic acid utilization activator n=1 Tax=Aspergillus homomorphus (strain CBS 101889) TaxID=1450537 RepID=A0A395HW39_ASPHC|nr:quinic acid utilization activator [Aspergillus homomorphus CBS 101889]RAL10434.1 quinic acid utilization activator [Aspergillus homomorphus CBS 101889]
MNNDTRQASGGASKSKRRLTEADEEPKQTPAADDLASNPKRQRVSRACDSCRSKKDKCDGVQPVCSTCASLSRPCTYKANPKKRGLPTGYIRTLELLWGLVFNKIQGSEEVVRALLRAANIPSHLATMGKEAEGSDTLLSSWKNSIVLKEIERLLTYLEQPEDDPGGNRIAGETYSPQDAEGSIVISSDTLEWNLSDVLGDAREGSLTVVSPVKTPTAASAMARNTALRVTRDTSTQTTSPADALVELSNPSLARLPSHLDPNSDSVMQKPLRLPSNAWPLFDIYFSYTHCWFPILEKHDILRTAFRHNDDDDVLVSPATPGSGDHAALWAVLTLASIQGASISATRQLTEFSADRPDPNQLYATAKSLIPGADGTHELGHVQALMILSLVKIGQQDWKAAWLLVGQAVRVAQSLGLSQPSTGQLKANEDGKSAGRSKHIFLGCFILETLVAMQTGQVPSLRKDDLLKIGPVNEDGLEEWHPWEDQTGLRPVESTRASFHRGPLHGLSTFNRLTSLMCILNDLCCLKQTSAGPTSQLEALERQLQLWVSALPKTYRVGVQGSQTKVASPHIFALEMVYESVATNLSLQIASQRDDRMVPDMPLKKRAMESSKRLLSLLQTYMETYSLSATCPTFGMILTFAAFPASESETAPLPFELDPGLKHKLQSFSAHLATVWNVNGRDPVGTIPADRAPDAPTPVDAAANRQRSLSNRESVTHNASGFPMSSLQTPTESARRVSSMDESRSNFATPDAFFSHAWMRTPNLEENVALSIPTPAPSLNITTHSTEQPLPRSQLKEPMSHNPRSSISTSKPMNSTPMIPDLTSPFHPTGPQYQQPYSDPNLAFGSFVDIEGYGPRRQKIAPDLDALFDELASLDGTEKTDNQPEFMQNLGFVPDAGVPEIYSYSTQVEPFLLAQTQQQVPCSEPGVVRRESQAVEASKR